MSRLRDQNATLPRPGLPSVVALILLAGLILLLQIGSGAYHTEFGSDEASHYVSSLMIHDYLLGGAAQSPLAYLRIFHSHYPVVGIGHWPPSTTR